MKSLLIGLLAALLTTTAVAQTVQPSYVRPSKGAPLVIAQVTATSTAATYTNSALFDWSAFAGVVVTVNMTGLAPTASACRYGVRVQSLGGTSTTLSDFFLLNVANNDYRASASQSWYVRVLPGYLRFSVGLYEANASGQPSCSYKVTATPLPFDYAGQLVSTGVVGTYAQSTGGEFPYSPAIVTSSPTLPYTRVQNIASSGVAYCSPVSESGVAPVYADRLTWPIQLEPYQSIEITNWVGTIHCVGTVGIFAH